MLKYEYASGNTSNSLSQTLGVSGADSVLQGLYRCLGSVRIAGVIFPYHHKAALAGP